MVTRIIFSLQSSAGKKICSALSRSALHIPGGCRVEVSVIRSRELRVRSMILPKISARSCKPGLHWGHFAVMCPSQERCYLGSGTCCAAWLGEGQGVLTWESLSHSFLGCFLSSWVHTDLSRVNMLLNKARSISHLHVVYLITVLKYFGLPFRPPQK